VLKLAFRLFVLAVIILLAANMARFLVIDRPQSADAIVVLAGETDKRPMRGLDLLRQGLAKRLVLDVPAESKIYLWNEIDIAQHYIQSLPEASQITVCPISGLSTKAESADVALCLKDAHLRRILLVTSDYHTRRALSIFARKLPAYAFSVSAAYDPQQFGYSWWRHREWAKTCLYEWMRLTWWELFDRWAQYT
jgi:hypothetical protein